MLTVQIFTCVLPFQPSILQCLIIECRFIFYVHNLLYVNVRFVYGNILMFQNQIVQGVGPQNNNFPTNQLFGMANLNGPLQLINQGQQRFPSPIMDVNASRQLVHVGQTHNPTNLEVSFLIFINLLMLKFDRLV